MDRKNRFRKERIYKLKIFIVFVLFFTILLSGLLVVDINKSYVMYGEPKIELFQVQMLDNDKCEVNILNSKLDLNLKYIKRDINSIKSYFNY